MVDNAVSVNEIEESFTSSPAYPNPAANMLHIPFRDIAVTGSVELFDMEGRLVLTQPAKFNGGILTVDMGELGNGVYTFKLTGKNGYVESFPVVVNK